MSDSEEELQERLAEVTEALQASEARAAAGQFALEQMHDVKGPIEALGYLTFLAAQQAEDPEAVRGYMRMAEEQMGNIHQIVNQTLGFARRSPTTRKADLSALAEAALRIHRRTVESKNVRLLKDLDDEVTAEVHMGEILQVISNLVLNALDALPAEGTLRVRLKKKEKEILVVIADNGHGIAEEHRHKVYEPFFSTKEDRGTGLGLSLSRKIVERHRGRITMRSSVRPGRSGTTFRISLPRSI